MGQVLDILISDKTLASQGVFFLLFLAVLYLLRSDSKGHKEEYKQTVHQMFDVVNRNTESNTKLSESIKDLKDRM